MVYLASPRRQGLKGLTLRWPGLQTARAPGLTC
jgi:hypothetical protein